MEWYHWVTPVVTVVGLAGTFAVAHYRIGVLEKKLKEEKEDSMIRCNKCQEQRKEERNQEAHRYERAVSLAEHNSAMLASHIATNASEHTKIEVSAARTEEQIKALCTKMDEMNRTLQFIVRTMPREYRPQHNTETDSLERK